MEKEKLEQQREMDRLRLIEEFRRDEERLSARKADRDDELTKLKQFQEQQLAELKQRETETEQLYQNKKELEECIKHLQIESTKLNTHENQYKERIHVSHNSRRIKMQLRNLSEMILKNLHFNISQLERLTTYYHTDEQQICHVRKKFEEQIDLEMQIQRQIECMYESEAKSFAICQQKIWSEELSAREKLVHNLIDDQIHQINNEIDFMNKRQNELNDLRECLRRSIDNSNERMKCLLGANSLDDELRMKSAESIHKSMTPLLSNIASTTTTPSNAGIHFDSEICLPDLFTKNMSLTDDNNDSSGRPQYGRKKIAWT